jgi:hypothetical protein
MKFEIEKNVVCSTSHVTMDDFKSLLDSNIVHIETYNGVIINLSSSEFDNDGVKNLEGFSNEFKELITLVKSHGFDNLKLDADGPFITGLRYFEW